MKLAIQHTPLGERVHIVLKIGNEMPIDADERTACGVDIYDLNSPELGEAQFKNIYAPDLNLNDPELCPRCKRQIEGEIASLKAWNERSK
jgi:hypothetical protein